MWKEVNSSTLGIAYQGTLGDLFLNHKHELLANSEHALIEGWAAFMEAVFEGVSIPPPYWVVTLVDIFGTQYSLGPPPPDNRGERVEGAFANGLWAVFENHVHSGITSSAHVQESSDGDVTTTASWIQNPTVQQRFMDMIWNPLKDLRSLATPSSTDMLQAIKSRNLARWPALQAELQPFNMAMAAPGITSISPSGGPTAGGQITTITGTEFVAGMTVKIGGKQATNVAVITSNSLTALTPSSVAAGAVDVLVETMAGANVLPQGYNYQ
jgi:hypothetical protein